MSAVFDPAAGDRLLVGVTDDMGERAAAKARDDLKSWLDGGEPPIAFLTGVTGMVVVKGGSPAAAPAASQSEQPGRCGECGGAKCPNWDCDRPYDQQETRWCPDCDAHQQTCANDHCLECGAAT